ncbi:hypothetical protein [Mesorhizobium sp. LjNodule214]|uniref:hypothetical protein n=1 Tax=Mesorhizobium sp. LjNodule214 TaxID=3342252 RepID=UPI003ECC30FE
MNRISLARFSNQRATVIPASRQRFFDHIIKKAVLAIGRLEVGAAEDTSELSATSVDGENCAPVYG